MLRLSFYVVIFCFVFAILRPPKESQNAYSNISNLENGNTGRILLLTAHPDDECMFFAPTITALVTRIYKDASAPRALEVESDRRNATILYSLCLSIGDADSLGHIRRGEIGRSLDVLGISKSNRWVLDHPDLKDNMTSHWSPKVIADALIPYIIEHQISTVLTFDEEGISNHPNHRSLPKGVMHLLKYHDHPTIPPPRLFTLITVPVATKYTGIIAPFLAKFDLYKLRLFYHIELLVVRLFLKLELGLPFPPDDPNSSQESMPVFVSGVSDYGLAIKAMREHASQLVWFRYLYIAFSRYMWVNEWAEVRIHSS